MGGVEDAVADGVGGGGVGEVVVPVLRIELAGEDRRADTVAVLEDFEQVAALGVGDGSDGEVVDDEDIEASEASERARAGTCRRRERDGARRRVAARGGRLRGILADKLDGRARTRGTFCRCPLRPR